MNQSSSHNPWLDTLESIQRPAEVGFWPLAPGWWILLLLAFLILLFLIWQQWLRRKSRLYRRQALKRLSQLRLDCYQPEKRESALRELPELLRRVALQSAGNRIAALTGPAWWHYLDQDLTDKPFQSGVGLLLEKIAYEPPVFLHNLSDADVEQLISLLGKWIEIHNNRGMECYNL